MERGNRDIKGYKTWDKMPKLKTRSILKYFYLLFIFSLSVYYYVFLKLDERYRVHDVSVSQQLEDGTWQAGIITLSILLIRPVKSFTACGVGTALQQLTV